MEERSSGKKKYAFNEVAGLEEVERIIHSGDYQKIKLAYAGHQFALIPKEHFDASNKSKLASAHFFFEKDDVLKVDSVYNLGIRNVYIPNGLGADHSHINRYHFISPLLSFLPTEEDRVCLLHTGKDALIVTYKDQKLNSTRYFPNLDENSAVYHLIEAFEMAEMHPHIAPLYIGGRLMPQSSLVHLIQRFIRHVNWLNIPGWRSEDSHLYYDAHLLSQYF